MTQFFWSSGHLGWAFFLLLVFTGLWWLLVDLAWRLWTVRATCLAAWTGLGWLAGVVLIVVVARVW